jgi:hypothetical protein
VGLWVYFAHFRPSLAPVRLAIGRDGEAGKEIIIIIYGGKKKRRRKKKKKKRNKPSFTYLDSYISG